MTRKEMYKSAAGLLERLVHAKGTYFIDGMGPTNQYTGSHNLQGCCVLGAIRAASGMDFTGGFNVPELARCLNVLTPYDIINWNDAPTTTKEDAVHALNCAAELCE